MTTLSPARTSPVGAFLAREGPAVRAAATVLLPAYVAIVAPLTLLGLALVHIGALDPVVRWDHHVSEWFVDHRTAALNRTSDVFTWIANTTGVVAVALVVTVFLLWRRWGRRAWLLLMGLGLELSCFLTINELVRRPRPDVPRVGHAPTTFSWPSGHCSATLVLYGGIAVLVASTTKRVLPRALAWTLAIVLTAGVAISRAYRGEHHLLDVIAGLVVGMAALTAAVVAMHRMEVAP